MPKGLSIKAFHSSVCLLGLTDIQAAETMLSMSAAHEMQTGVAYCY